MNLLAAGVHVRVKRVAIWGLFFTALLSGCATNSLFSPYPLQAEVIKQQVMAGEFSAAQMFLEKQSRGADKMLYLMERGRIAQIAGNIEASVQDFEQVLDLFEANEAAAKVTASGAISKAGAVMLNENAAPYRGATYERIFVHSFQALNFLNQRNLEAAAVEVRRANFEQQQALLQYEDDLVEAEQRDRKSRNRAMILAENRDYKQKFSSLTSLSSKVKNSFQNAYTFYISGLIYEINGEYNDAYIDYSKALEIYPGNRYLRSDVARLAQYLGMEEGLKVATEKTALITREKGRVVVLYEQGYAPEKQEINLFLDLYGVPNNMVFPTYVNHEKNYRPLFVGLSGHRLGKTETIVEISAMAAKALEERLPGMIVRQGVRAIAREHWNERHQDNLFIALADLGQLLLNRADLRSWSTLPAEVQILNAFVNEGQQTLTLSNGIYNDEVNIQVSSGQTTVVHVIAAGGRLHTWTITL